MIDDLVIIICSRKESSRIPEKAFKKICGYTPIEHILKRIESIDCDKVLAIPREDGEDYRIFNGNDDKNLTIFVGDSKSPLHRMNECLYFYERKYKYVCRITHDDPLIDADVLMKLYETCKREDAGYGISPSLLEGAAVEIIAVENIMYAASQTEKPIEHVSYFVKGEGCPNTKIIRIGVTESKRRNYRLTMDYPEDAVILEAILRKTGPFASTEDIVKVCDQHRGMFKYNKMPLVTFYTCVKDGAEWIQKTIESVLNTDIQDFEYIIIDDGSSDDTLLKISPFLGDNRIKIIVNDENKGLASSSNVALSIARGKFVMRIDADDILLKNVSKMIDKARHINCGIVYASYNTIDEDGEILTSHRDPKEHHHAGCALMNKMFINELKFRDGLRNWDSLELYKRISEKFSVGYIDEPMWLYRNHSKSMSINNLEERAKALDEINVEDTNERKR